MIVRLQILFFAVAALAAANLPDSDTSPIPDKDIVIFVDFWGYSETSRSSTELGSVILANTGKRWVRSGTKGEWRKMGDVTATQIGEYRTLVTDPKSLKVFTFKDDKRRFRLNMDNYHVQFPETVRALYRALLAPRGEVPK